jgi:predicted small lipoprotein YifL
MNKHFRSAWATAVLAALTACGGGGGGSPPTTDTNTKTTSVRLDRTHVSLQGTTTQSDAATIVNFVFSGDTSPNVLVGMSATLKGLALVNLAGDSTDSLQLALQFKPAAALPNGSYSDEVRVDVCWDAECTRPLAGSPLVLTTTFTVSDSSVTTGEPLDLRVDPNGVLTHDVVAAQVSKPLNAIVMASSWPTSALYVYDMATRTERRADLALAPTGLTLSTDGRFAAVGHDARITHVDLASVGDPAGIILKLLNVSAPVFDLVLDDSATVHAFPVNEQFVGLHSIKVATNVETVTFPAMTLFAGTRAHLNPANGRVYTLDTQIYPQSLRSFALDGNAASVDWRSQPSASQYPGGSNFWFSEDGLRIYSGSGNTFHASATATSDMQYAGRLGISPSYATNSVVWASHFTGRREIAALDAGQCAVSGPLADCGTLLRIMDDDVYTSRGSFWLHPVAAELKLRPQHGLYVFHAADGTRFVISRVVGVTDKSHEHYITAVPAGTL